MSSTRRAAIADHRPHDLLSRCTAHGNNKEQVLCFFPARGRRGRDDGQLITEVRLNIEVCVEDIFASHCAHLRSDAPRTRFELSAVMCRGLSTLRGRLRDQALVEFTRRGVERFARPTSLWMTEQPELVTARSRREPAWSRLWVRLIRGGARFEQAGLGRGCRGSACTTSRPKAENVTRSKSATTVGLRARSGLIGGVTRIQINISLSRMARTLEKDQSLPERITRARYDTRSLGENRRRCSVRRST